MEGEFNLCSWSVKLILDEEKILIGLDKETNELLLIEPLESMEEEMEMRMSLLISSVTA